MSYYYPTSDDRAMHHHPEYISVEDIRFRWELHPVPELPRLWWNTSLFPKSSIGPSCGSITLLFTTFANAFAKGGLSALFGRLIVSNKEEG